MKQDLSNNGIRNSDTINADDNRIYCNSNPSYVWCLPESYTAEENPFQHAEMAPLKPLPWNYTFNFIVKNIGKIDDKSQSISISMYFAVRWFEPRLVINESAKAWSEIKLGPADEVTISSQNLKHLWYPELEIYGIENFRRYNVLREMSGLRIRKDRTINYELKVEVRISCQMNFKNYPLDEQTCLFQVGSYYGSNKTIQCESNLTYDTSKQKNIQHAVKLMSLPIQNKTVSLISGNYAVCGFSIHLTRKRMQNVVQIFMPSFMFVVASWISFVVKPDMVPGRMALLVSILLILLNLFNNAKDKGPESNNDISAVDLYLVFSMFLVFTALMEYAVVLVLMKLMPSWTLKLVDDMSFKRKLAWDNAICDSNNPNDHAKPVNLEKLSNSFDTMRNNNTSSGTKMDNKNIDELEQSTEFVCKKLDFISLCLAPIVFTIFHIGYLIKYA